VHCEVSQVLKAVGLQDTATEAMLAAVSVMVADADLVVSALLVAVSVTVAVALTEAGAV
jgi:hypothetical protein